MKNTIFTLVLSLAISSWMQGQVGILTSTPQAMLHVNGDLQVDGQIKTGGNATTAGDAGQSGQVLASNGAGIAPTWKSLSDLATLPVIAMVARSNADPTIYSAVVPANTTQKMSFGNIQTNNINYIEYNPSTQEFNVKISGYYKFSSYFIYFLGIDTSPTPPPPPNPNPGGQREGGARTTILRNGTDLLTGSYSTHGVSTSYIYHSVSGTAYLNVNDKITINGFLTRPSNMRCQSFAIRFLKP